MQHMAYVRRDRRIRRYGLANSYQAYLKTQLWKGVRSRVLRRDGHVCRICGEPATQAHHTNYARKTLQGVAITGIFAICRPCHEWIEFNDDGSKAHLVLDTRDRIRQLAELKGRVFVWPGDERRPCRDCQRLTGLASLDDDGRCRRCRKRHTPGGATDTGSEESECVSPGAVGEVRHPGGAVP